MTNLNWDGPVSSLGMDREVADLWWYLHPREESVIYFIGTCTQITNLCISCSHGITIDEHSGYFGTDLIHQRSEWLHC